MVCDNASANDKMTTKLAQTLPTFMGEESHIQCFLHIVNLIAKAIICQFDASKGRLETEEDEEDDEDVDKIDNGGGDNDDNDDDDDNDNNDDGNDDNGISVSIQPV